MRLARLLDPRPTHVALAAPIREAVNIPAVEIAARRQELPPSEEPICLPDLPESLAACEVLGEMGRVATLAPFEFGDSGPLRLWRPSPWIERMAPTLPVGRALDLGCGAGRDAVFLAALGWSVVAVDHLPDAVARGRDLAARYLDDSGRIEWRVGDARGFGGDGSFDLLVMVRFLDRVVLGEAVGLLAPGGAVLLETFSTLHRERHGKPRDAVDPGEIGSLCPGLEVMRAEAEWEGARHFARLWARRSSPSA